MHEYGLSEGILDAVHKRADGRPVAWVRVRAGVRHGVDAESMSQAFSSVAAGTEAASAKLDLVPIPVDLECRGCGNRSQSHDLLAVCPECGGDDLDITGGDELTLEAIGYDGVEAPPA